MTLLIPPRRCYRDGCHIFQPETANHIYCTECGCKRKFENARKRLTKPLNTHEDMVEHWELQEQRKMANALLALERNDHILQTKSIGFFDIEATNLSASIGEMLSASVKTYRDPEVWSVWQAIPEDDGDRTLVVNVRDYLETFDYVCTFYGTGYDIPFLNTRLLIHGERPLAQIRHLDLYYVARHNLKLHSNRLAVVEETLLGEGTKTRVLGPVWTKAQRGDRDAMKYIVDHCELDVIALESAFERLRGFVNFSAIKLRKYGGSGYGGIG